MIKDKIKYGNLKIASVYLNISFILNCMLYMLSICLVTNDYIFQRKKKMDYIFGIKIITVMILWFIKSVQYESFKHNESKIRCFTSFFKKENVKQVLTQWTNQIQQLVDTNSRDICLSIPAEIVDKIRSNIVEPPDTGIVWCKIAASGLIYSYESTADPMLMIR